MTATEKATGLAKTVTMDTRGHKVLDVDQARRNIASLVGQNQAAEALPEGAPVACQSTGPEELLNTAKDLHKRAEALLQAKISAEDAEEIRTLMQESAAAIEDSDWPRLEDKTDALSDLLFYLED